MKYDLKDNPFKERFDHDIVGEDRVKTVEQVCQLLERCARIPEKKQKGDRALAVINGTYGEGKTFTLWHLQNTVLNKAEGRKRFFANPNVRIASSRFRLLTGGKLPSKPFLYLYKNIMYNLGDEHDGRTFLNALKDEDLARIAKSKKTTVASLLSDIKSPYRDIFLQIGKDQPNEYFAIQWLMGSKLKKKEMETLNVQFCIDDDKKAELALRETLKLLAIADYNELVVLADEAEDVMAGGGKKTLLNYLITLRDIWNSTGDQLTRNENAAPLVFISAFSPEVWDIVQDSAEKSYSSSGGAAFQPFVHRLNENIFYLKSLSSAEARELVELLLKKERNKPRKDPYYPFEAEAIELIREAYSGNPRKIIGFCGKCLIEAEKNDAKSIDKDFVTKMLQGQGSFEGSPEAPSTDDSYKREI